MVPSGLQGAPEFRRTKVLNFEYPWLTEAVIRIDGLLTFFLSLRPPDPQTGNRQDNQQYCRTIHHISPNIRQDTP
jgi:hypothetical protein